MAREPKDPDSLIRFPALLTVATRGRLRIVAAHLGRSMEDLAGGWIAKRLAEVESELGLVRPGAAAAEKKPGRTTKAVRR